MSSGDAFDGDGELHGGSFEAQHRIIASEEPPDLPRVASESGPVSIAPRQAEIFAKAVTHGGGTLIDLDNSTRGLIWLSNSRVEELDDVLTAQPQLSWVQLPWAGVDAFSSVLRRHMRPDLIFTSAKGCFAQPVAEHAVMLALSLLRYIPRRARATSWDSTFLGISLYRKNVVLVGGGGIAREIIRLLAPFDTHVTVVRRLGTGVSGAHLTVTSDRLNDVLPSADVVFIVAASTEETRHLIGTPQLALMKSTAALVNVARGAIVDSAALVESLAAGHLVGAATDVTEPEPLPDGHPLWTAPNMLITPHMADTPEMTGPLLAERVRRNVTAFVRGEQLEGVVNPLLGY
ncbi:MAG: D-isomer specific 2-hydroxyacid dehydrogenase family protein [Microbacteriaceae bacterium]